MTQFFVKKTEKEGNNEVQELINKYNKVIDEVIDYIEQADSILVKFGATTDRFMPSNELKKLCVQHDLHTER